MGLFKKPKAEAAEQVQETTEEAATEEKEEAAAKKQRLVATTGEHKGQLLNEQQGKSIRRIFG